MAGDYIRRDLAKKRFSKRLMWLKEDVHDEYSGALLDGCETDIELLDEIPAADVVEVVHGTPVTEVRTRTIVGYHEEIGVLAGDRSTLYRRNMVHADIPYDHCPICGATLCSRWHNFCGKCGAKMDGDVERGK